jgi:putative membrane protein
MVAKSFFAFLHFAAAFGLVATVFFEWTTFSRTPTAIEARRIAVADRWYGAFAGALLAVGFLRVFYFEKGADFYFHSPFFHLKLTLFVVMGLLSIYPTVRFLKWRDDIKAGRAPNVTEAQYRGIHRCLTVQMIIVLPLLASASLMAAGVGR